MKYVQLVDEAATLESENRSGGRTAWRAFRSVVRTMSGALMLDGTIRPLTDPDCWEKLAPDREKKSCYYALLHLNVPSL
jgi:hypothetical protein